ncbi:MAG TPA: hypothetical protein VFW25_11115 [Silvibacterium sp.]|nr:hypothetical protein [Silvibacterium sp.]
MISRIRKPPALVIPALLVFLAGCGVGQFGTVSANGAFSIAESAAATSSNGQIQFSARMPSGETAAVVWSVAGGENASSLGEGHIDATGLYTPPEALSQDTVRIQIAARLKDDAAETARAVVSVTPGFVQSLLPENAWLSTGTTIEATAEIAEVNAGAVHWSLSRRAQGGGGAGGADKGTLSNESCQRSLDQYTTCKVSYTAPSVATGGAVYLRAAVNGAATTAPLKILLNRDGVSSSPMLNQAAQTGAVALGASGGNDNDFDTYKDATGESYVADCCGGTLGALVEDGRKEQYILSNNHVLAESDQGRTGDAIDEPGMIDDGCVPLSHAGSTLRPIGTLKYVVPLNTPKTNVDAALAMVAAGAVDANGSILQLAAPDPAASVRSPGANEMLGAAPPVAGDGEVLNASNLNGLKLAKSGRTTGLTCSTVAAVDLSVKVDYFKDCAETQSYFTKTFTGQIGIAGDRFSDSGDSGALVVDASNAEPVGLFFAGGTDGRGHGLSIANPIGDVLNELGERTGSSMTVAGTATPHAVACVRYDSSAAAESAPVGPEERARAERVAQTGGAALVNPENGILGMSSGASLDNPGEAALVVYVDKTKGNLSVPQTVDGLRTQVIATDMAELVRDSAPKTPSATDGIALSASVLARAKAVVKQYAPRLLDDPAIFGVGVTQSLDNPHDPALLVLVDPEMVDSEISRRAMPAVIGGVRVRYMELHRFHVTRSKYAGLNAAPSCALKKLAGSGIADRGVLH